MKIIVAFDSFKGTIRALPACQIVKDALLSVRPDLQVLCLPMADGGEGTAEIMLHNRGGQWIPKTVTGPFEQMQVRAGYARLGDDMALVEMASASGLELLTRKQMNPLETTTYGTGELIRDAVEQGVRKIYLAVGGSATVDGGVGAASALGWRFLNRAGRPVGPVGGELSHIHKILKPSELPQVPIEVLCDVTNPLCGPAGAARIYGPQKGASPEAVEILEHGLFHLAELIRKQLGKEVQDLPGAGAAGGLAAGAVAFLNASIVSGIDTILQQSRFAEQAQDADWIITGEGSFDSQSLYGKVISGVLKAAQRTHAKAAVLAGQISISPDLCRQHGIQLATACRKKDMPLDYALENAESLLSKAAEEIAGKLT